MAKVVLISCVSKKLDHRSKTEDMYISSLFQKSLRYAKSLHPDKIYVLSAEYGLLRLNQKINPYNKTLNEISSEEKKHWADNVLGQLRRNSNLLDDEFIFLAGENYRKYLLPYIQHYKIPMEGLSIGKQLQWLTENE